MKTSVNKYAIQAGDETSAAQPRREAEGFYEKYLNGKGIDIGPGHKAITEDCDTWDNSKGNPDATYLAGVQDAKYDWVYSSHLLEHTDAPEVALEHWLRVLKPDGYLIVSVPDEDLYEQGVWPSVFNPDHRYSYTAYKSKSWNSQSKNVLDLIKGMEGVKLISLRIIDTNYDYTQKFGDQKKAEKSVEFIVQKQGLQYAIRDSMHSRLTCFCGSYDLKLEGIYKDGQVLIRCRSCGHFAKNDIKDTLRDLGFIVERASK